MRLPQGPASSWGLAYFILCLAVLLLLLAGQTAHGQTLSSSEPPSLTSNYSEAEQTLTLLLERLNERKLQVLLLQSSLSEADARLGSLLQNLQDLQTLLQETQESYNRQQTDLMATSNSLDALSKRYADLEASWLAYREEMRGQVVAVQRERDRSRLLTRILLCSTVMCGITTLIFALK